MSTLVLQHVTLEPPSTTPLLHSSWWLLIAGIAIGVLSTLFTGKMRDDWKAFTSLGPGGTSQTIAGFTKLQLLAIFRLRDPYKPAPVPADLARQAYLSNVPDRAGPRPRVMGLVPHRQADQRSTGDIQQRFRSFLKSLPERMPGRLKNATSCLEKHCIGLFALSPVNDRGICPEEVMHCHDLDGSMHLVLHPADAQIVIRQGWGERHPLGRGGWMGYFVPSGIMMVYAPRDEHELEVVKEIVAAACWWHGGIDICVREDGEREMAPMGKTKSWDGKSLDWKI